MFGDIGLAEILLVALVVILVTRPQDLPVVMRRAGLVYAHVHMFLQGVWLGWQEKLGLLNAPGPRRGQEDDAAWTLQHLPS